MNKPSPVTEDKVAAQEAKELRRKQKKDAIEEEEKRKLAEEVRSLAAKQEAERRIAKERQENLKRKEKAVMGEERKLAGQDEEARLTVAKPGAERHDAEDKLEIQRRRRADAARRLAGREVEAAPSCPTVVVVVDVALSCSKVVETAPNCHKADEGSPGGLEENKIEKIVDVGLCNCNEARKMRLLESIWTKQAMYVEGPEDIETMERTIATVLLKSVQALQMLTGSTSGLPKAPKPITTRVDAQTQVSKRSKKPSEGGDGAVPPC